MIKEGEYIVVRSKLIKKRDRELTREDIYLFVNSIEQPTCVSVSLLITMKAIHLSRRYLFVLPDNIQDVRHSVKIKYTTLSRRGDAA
jgi:hypothetical protein